MDPRNGEPGEGPTVNDRRRFDPETGELRQPNDGADAGSGAGGAQPERPGGAAASSQAGGPTADEGAAGQDELAAARAEASDRLEALLRLKAEYENYRKRVDRDRDLVRESAVASVLRELLSVLDDIGRARDHGDLTGGFRSVGEALEAVTQKFGLVQYGEVGDEFDPTIHEALMHEYSDEVDVPTCTQVLMPGYRHGDKVLRAARVAVADPTEALPQPDPAEGTDDGVADNSDTRARGGIPPGPPPDSGEQGAEQPGEPPSGQAE